MKSMLGMCISWKVLAGLGVVGGAVVVFAPGYALAVLPLLLLAICPLSMVAMMFAMKGMGSMKDGSMKDGSMKDGSMSGDGPSPAQGDVSGEAVRTRLAALRDEERQLEQELSSRSATQEESPAPGAAASRERVAS